MFMPLEMFSQSDCFEIFARVTVVYDQLMSERQHCTDFGVYRFWRQKRFKHGAVRLE